MPFEEEEKHDSYGVIGFSRVSGDPGNLFGSSLTHQNFIRLRVKRAVKHRELHRNWYHGHGELLEVDMSPIQFAELLTNMNCGDGVPCTIKYVEGKPMPECPAVDERQTFEDEFKADVDNATADAAKLVDAAVAILNKPTISRSDRKELLDALRMLMQNIRCNMPFVHKQFGEAMDKTAAEAKGSVEAFVQHKIISLGIEALRQKIENTLPTLPAVNQVKKLT